MQLMVAVAAVLLLLSCGQAASPAENREKREGLERIAEESPPQDQFPVLPAHDILIERDCAETGIVGKCYSVSTDATSREDLEVVTAHLWLKSPGYLAVLVSFYPNKLTADLSGAGFAFKNEQVARVILTQVTAEGTTVEDEVREAMANGGIYIIAAADKAQEFAEGT